MKPTLFLSLLLMGAPICSFLAWGDSESGPKTPLDLPSGGHGFDEDSEDLPESIHFFGSIYEGTGFFFLVDKSGSMNGTKMDQLKAELTSVIGSLSSGSYFGMVSDKRLPAWVAEFDCTTWAQFSLKYILAHPAVTCVLTETTNPAHMEENIQAGFGRLPDEATKRRMREAVA